jgi:hypothetical protein
MAYRLSRNVEASVIDKITADLVTDGWTGIYCEKVFSEIYEGHFPAILVNVTDRPEKRLEVGSDGLSDFVNIEIRIFAENDGQKLDLADWILPKIMTGINYYTYNITGGIVSEKILAGRISVLEITANRKELANLEGLAKEDKYRHLISVRARVAL